MDYICPECKNECDVDLCEVGGTNPEDYKLIPVSDCCRAEFTELMEPDKYDIPSWVDDTNQIDEFSMR